MKQSFGIKAFVVVAAVIALAGLGFLILTQTNKQVQTANEAESTEDATFPDAPAVQQTVESTALSNQSTTMLASTTRQTLSEKPKVSVTAKPSGADVQAQRPTQTEPKEATPATQATNQGSPSPAQLAGSQTLPNGIGPIEAEIFRLTNAYRSDPTGSLARVKSLPVCGKESNQKKITIAHIQALQPLELDVTVSLNMSRAWSKEMSATADPSGSLKSNLRHSDNEWRFNVYQKLGVFGPNIRSYGHGENILVFSNYRSSVSDPNELAKKMFEGWRESDGHFCNIINESFTHLGVGHYYDAAGEFDWATQNFHFAK